MQNKLLVISGGSKSFRSDLRALLKKNPLMGRILEADDSSELCAIVAQNQVAVLLLDAAWLADNQEPTLQKNYGLSAQTSCLIFHDELTQRSVRDALIRGARGCLLKSSPKEDWRKAIKTVSCDGIWFPQQLLSDALVSELRRPRQNGVETHNENSLTSREREIRECVTEGMTNKEIARWLGISPTTVKTHLQHMFGKLHVNHRVLLLRNGDASML